MITARFTKRDGRYVSFSVSGHAGFAERGDDIVCAAVTSCVELVANTLTDVMRVRAQVLVEENRVCVSLPDGAERGALQLMEGFYEHMRHLAGQYPDHVRALCA